MGDRVLMQCHGADSIGPVIYGHWSGGSAPEAVAAMAKRMANRKQDVEYASARLVQELIGNDRGDTGFGIWNAKAGQDGKPRLLVEGDSHGDAGVILIDCDNDFKATCFGGYLRVKEDGSIVSKYDEEGDEEGEG